MHVRGWIIRAGRLAFWGLVLLAVLIGGFLGAALGRVNRESYQGREYTVRTEARMPAGRPPSGGAEDGGFRAGFGRAKLTPTLGAAADRPEQGEFTALPLAGYGQREGKPAAGVHDDVWVKAVAFASGGRTGVVVSADLLIVPREVTELAVERLRSQCGLGRGDVYFGATHTHCSLGGWGEGLVAEAFSGGFRPGVRHWIASRLAAAASDAVRDLAPAAVAGGGFEAPEFTRNRLVGDQGRIDPEFALLQFRQTGEGGRTAVVGSYSAHATVLSGRFMEFSGDYPGFWQRSVEAGTGGLAMFLAGGVGSHSPKAPASGLEGAQRMGEALAGRTLETLRGMTPDPRVSASLTTLEVDLPPLQPRVTDGLRLREWLARRVLPVRPTTWLQALRLGDRVWLSAPCDYSGELALDLKAEASRSGLRAAVTSFNGDYVGYVVPAKYYSLDTYETRTMSFFGPQLPDFFDALLRRLVQVSASSATSAAPTAGAP